MNPQLHDYIVTYLKQGYSKEGLVQHLLNHGYDINSINEVFNYIEGHQNQLQENQKNNLQLVNPKSQEEVNGIGESSEDLLDKDLEDSMLEDEDEAEKDEKKKFKLTPHSIMTIVVLIVFILFMIYIWYDYNFIA